MKEKDPAAFAALKPPQFVILDEGGKLATDITNRFGGG
jgi:hypothetical protein